MFFTILEKSKNSITSLAIKCRQFSNISPTSLESNLITIPKLQELDLLKFA